MANAEQNKIVLDENSKYNIDVYWSPSDRNGD